MARLEKAACAAASQILLDQIFLTLIRGYDFVNTNESFVAGTAALMHLETAMKYIDANLDSPLTLEDIAKNALMSRSYFCTVLKKFNGISPWDYITIKRIEKSVRLLKTSDMNKIEIASPSNFYKAFRHVTGKKTSDIT